MTMPPFAEDPEASRPHFAAPARAGRARTACAHLSMGTSQDYAVAVEEGATIVRLGSTLYDARLRSPCRELRARRRTHSPTWAFSDTWHRTLVYFGLAEDRDAYDDERRARPTASPRPSSRSRYRERPERAPPVVRAAAATRSTTSSPTTPRRAAHDACCGPVGGSGAGRATAARDVRVHLVIPKSFNDAQDVADKFKDSIPVILNLQGSDTDLSKRLIDFASGLTYALDGGMQRIADKVFLLTPRNVEVSAEERARLIEKGFFNQS